MKNCFSLLNYFQSNLINMITLRSLKDKILTLVCNVLTHSEPIMQFYNFLLQVELLTFLTPVKILPFSPPFLWPHFEVRTSSQARDQTHARPEPLQRQHQILNLLLQKGNLLLVFSFALLWEFFWQHPWHMEVPRPGMKSDGISAETSTYATAAATPDPNPLC